MAISLRQGRYNGEGGTHCYTIDENKICRSLGDSSVKVLRRLKLFSEEADCVLPEGTKNYGSGTAYRWTLRLMWGVCLLVVAALIAIASSGKIVSV